MMVGREILQLHVSWSRLHRFDRGLHLSYGVGVAVFPSGFRAAFHALTRLCSTCTCDDAVAAGATER